MVIVKSPAPEYPSDFTGGFILINTKDMPSENSFNLSVGAAVNDNTHFRDFYYNKGSKPICLVSTTGYVHYKEALTK